MSAWMPAGVYAFWIGWLGQNWAILAAPFLVAACVWTGAATLRWIDYATR